MRVERAATDPPHLTKGNNVNRTTDWQVKNGLGIWSVLGPAAAESLSLGHVDWIALDAQHGCYDDLAVRETLHHIAPATDVFVRVPKNDAAWIGRALDAGARGVIVPMVEDGAQAADAARACRYPPDGQRSWGQFASHWGKPELTPAEANRHVVCAVMIETRKGLDNADAIAATPGVDMIFLGPFDLSIALGTTVDALLQGDGGELETIVAACRRHDVIAGAFAGDPARADRLAQLGFEVLAPARDRELLTAAAEKLANQRRG